MTKVNVAFRNFGNAPKNHSIDIVEENESCLFRYTQKAHKCTVPAGRSVFRRLLKIAKSDYWLRHACLSVRSPVRPSARIEHLGSYWTDFHDILYLSIFLENL